MNRQRQVVTVGRPLRVAILGGGMGALAAAWELTEATGAQRYEVTVYERGWRLGGKAASGRNLAAGSRIEEHGLHVLMGFYGDTLRVLRHSYEAMAGVRTAHGTVLPWDRALVGWDEATLAERLPGGGAAFWKVRFPTNHRTIGDDARRLGLRALLGRALRSVLAACRQLSRMLRTPLEVAGGLIERAVHLLLERSGVVARLSERLAQAIEGALWACWRVVRLVADHRPRVRRLWMALYFTGANVLGLLRDGVLLPGFDFTDLDHHDYKAWLHGHTRRLACPAHLSWDSPPVNAMYDLAFSRSTTFAAGTMVRDALELLFDYRGHVSYKMNGGMGDVVFAPLYLALVRRGVRFRFFHRVTALHPNAAGGLEAIELEEQIATTGAYDPLVSVHGLPCWPSEPDGRQLTSAYRERRSTGRVPCDFEGGASPFARAVPPLRRGRDFDVAVLGIPVGALAFISGPLMAANPAFDAMVRNVRTMATQAVQLWLTRTPEQLGWSGPGAMVISCEDPFNSWVDMSHLLPAEAWPEPRPRQLAYFCDALPSPPAEGADELVRRGGIERLQRGTARLWPRAALPTFDWDALYDPECREGDARFAAQYWRANVDPSSRFVLSVCGSTRHRLRPDGSGFTNLALAGDWVRTDLNAGCLEAATRAGLGAARAIVAGRVRP